MKNLKKINLGLILTIITILAVVIYSVNLEAQRKSSKEDIRKSCEEYISIVDKYIVLPEELQKIEEDPKSVNLDDYNANMEQDLREAMVSESAVEIQKTILSDIAEKDLLNTSTFIISYDRKIKKINSYNFDGNQVTVTFESKITTKQKYLDVNIETGEKQEKVKENNCEVEGDMITLEKKDGKWKVVYSNFDYGFNNHTNAM